MKALQTQSYRHLLTAVILLFGVAVGAAQTLGKPAPDFSYACASASFNSFTVSFAWQSPAVNADNQFILELSDASGSFNDPVVLSTLSDKNTSYEFKFNITLNETIAGDSYRVRVKSTSPAKESAPSDPFSAYYMTINEALVVNNFQESSICESGSTILTVDNFPDEPAYNWYKDMVLIPGAKGPELEVIEPGIYFAELDYGAYCSVNTASNLVEVYQEASVAVSITGPSEVVMCQGDSYTLQADMDSADYSYTWFKDNTLIAQNSSASFIVDAANPGFEGVYYVMLTNLFTGCEVSSNPVTISSDGFTTAIEAPQGNLLLPGSTVSLQASTSASTPQYAWYKDGIEIAGATASSYIADSPGVYRAKITQSGGCVSEKFTPEVAIIAPESYSISLNTAGYTACMTGALALELDKVEALSSGTYYTLEETALATFNYQWLKDGAMISGATARNHTVSGMEASGNYTLQVEIGGTPYKSDAFQVQMGIEATPEISAPVTLSCNDGVMLDIISNMSSPDYEYVWYRNGTPMTAAGTGLQTTLPGTYELEVLANGCSVKSNPVVIEEINSDMVQLDVPEKFSIPEGDSRMVTATGADSYTWMNTENQVLSTGATVTLSEEGQYLLKAVVGNCEVMKTIELTYQLSYTVPNAITPNGDGFNDLWVLPSAYAFQPDISVTIFNEKGIQVFFANQYQNNWPQASDLVFKGERPPIYYYTISKGKDILKRGTITVVK